MLLGWYDIGIFILLVWCDIFNESSLLIFNESALIVCSRVDDFIIITLR